MARQAGLNGDAFTSVKDAVAAARKSMRREDALLVTGSFFIVGEAMDVLGGVQRNVVV